MELNRSHHIIPGERQFDVDPWTHIIYNPADGAIILSQDYIIHQSILLNRQNIQRLIDIVHQIRSSGGGEARG